MIMTTVRKNRILDLLRLKNITPYRLAEIVKMSRTTIYTLVNAGSIPDGTTYATLRKVADALNVSLDELETKQ